MTNRGVNQPATNLYLTYEENDLIEAQGVDAIPPRRMMNPRDRFARCILANKSSSSDDARKRCSTMNHCVD